MSDPQIRYCDAHTHIHFAAFEEDADAVAKRAFDAGVTIINVGTQKDTSLKAIEFSKRYPKSVYATVGLHPIHTAKSYHDVKELGGGDAAKGFTSRGEIFDFELYKKMASDPKVVAIGECGLDYYRVEEEDLKVKQREVFVQHIKLSAEVGKPLMIHCRNAFHDLIEILKANQDALNSPPGACHFFTGTVEDAHKLVDLGFYFTFGGVITFARDYDEAIKAIPLDRILTETDAPYVSPEPYRGKRNEPAYVVEVVKKLAALKELSVEKMAEHVYENAKRIFHID